MADIRARLQSIVGAAHVVVPGDAAFDERFFTDPYAFSEDFRYSPPGAVSPANTAEVQAVVRLANELGFGLWVVSRGRNLGYGGGMPRRKTDWVLDLSRMNRVLEVNVELGYAVIEPGVSFFDLYEHLHAMQAPVFVSVPDLGYGSVLGNALERGIGYTRYGDHGQYLCGLEVVAPTGELLHTGMRADSDSRTAFAYKGGFGPDVLGLFQQSNFGVVTNAAVWLAPVPEQWAAIRVSVAHEAELGALVDALRPLQLEGLIDTAVIVGNILAIASGIAPREAFWHETSLMPNEVIDGVAQQFGLGYWNAKFGVYGSERVVDAKIAELRDRLAVSLPGADTEVNRYPGHFDQAQVPAPDYPQLAIPSGDLLQMAAWRGGSPAHTDYCVVCPTTGADAQLLVETTRATLNAHGLDHAGGFTMYGRHAIFLSLIAFDGASTSDRALVERVYEELLDRGNALGFAPYRAHPRFMDKIADFYDADERGLTSYLSTMKHAVDPNAVLSIGKQGIW